MTNRRIVLMAVLGGVVLALLLSAVSVLLTPSPLPTPPTAPAVYRTPYAAPEWPKGPQCCL